MSNPQSSKTNQFTVLINGKPHIVSVGTTIEELLCQLKIPEAGTAVELSGQVLAASNFKATELLEGQQLEIVRFVGGG